MSPFGFCGNWLLTPDTWWWWWGDRLFSSHFPCQQLPSYFKFNFKMSGQDIFMKMKETPSSFEFLLEVYFIPVVLKCEW